MKLMFCPKCQDVIKLRIGQIRSCHCGECSGEYIDDLLARINSKAILIGFDNKSLKTALKHRPHDGLGFQFNAFVIPEKCSNIVVDPRLDK